MPLQQAATAYKWDFVPVRSYTSIPVISFSTSLAIHWWCLLHFTQRSATIRAAVVVLQTLFKRHPTTVSWYHSNYKAKRSEWSAKYCKPLLMLCSFSSCIGRGASDQGTWETRRSSSCLSTCHLLLLCTSMRSVLEQSIASIKLYDTWCTSCTKVVAFV